jgi:hypothetical protein
MQQFPMGRDAAYYWHADVYDANGVRYPIRLMIDGIAIASLRSAGNPIGDDIVKLFYHKEIEALLSAGGLKPEGESGSLNTIFFAAWNDARQAQQGDIVVYNACEKLKDVALSKEI